MSELQFDMKKDIGGGQLFIGSVINNALADNASLYIQFTSPANNIRVWIDLHAVITENAKKSGELILYENPLVTEGTTALILKNQNRRSSKLSSMKGVYSNPSAVSGGEVFRVAIGTGNQDSPIILLKPDVKYIAELINRTSATSNCGLLIHFYECGCKD